MVYDVIGDVHGQAEALDRLLAQLGYQPNRHGVWQQPPGHHAVFVGDLIDRGPQQLAVLQRVHAMQQAGFASVVLGNHEFNAICWVTPDQVAPGQWLRPHTAGNRRQHQAFLDAVGEGSSEHRRWVAWFRQLPVAMEHEDFRVVHACWDGEKLAQLAAAGVANMANDDLLQLCGSKPRNHPLFHAIETVLKGREVRLPDGMHFTDKDGKVRHDARLKWWDIQPHSLADSLLLGPVQQGLPAEWSGAHDLRHPIPTDKPIFFGHYWLRGEPRLTNSHAVCVDYSAGAGHFLVAARWAPQTGEPITFFYAPVSPAANRTGIA